MRTIVFALFAAGCSGSGLSIEEVDNPDALEPIPPPPVVDGRDERENPYDEDEGVEDPVDDGTDDPTDPTDDGVDDPVEDPTDTTDEEDPPEDPVEPPEDPVEPPEDPVDPPPSTCPAGVICVDSFPFVESNTTVGAPSNIDSYACSPGTDESGPERVYQLELAEPGFLAITLFGLPSDVDVDVHLLHSTDPNTCIDRGHWDAASLLDAGTYTVVVDSWVSGSGVVYNGAYSVRFHHTPFDAFAGDGLSSSTMERALTAFDEAWHDQETSSLLYTVTDFDLPSTQPRLWTFSLATGDLYFHELVTHGEASSSSSNPAMVAQMSNINGSHMSSVGLMRTAETYYGSKGYSMRLDGLESGYNDLVRPRAIVVHSATYATQAFVNANGYLGRSWGCPAVDPQVNQQLIDTIKNGTLFFSHFSDPSWLASSDYL